MNVTHSWTRGAVEVAHQTSNLGVVSSILAVFVSCLPRQDDLFCQFPLYQTVECVCDHPWVFLGVATYMAGLRQYVCTDLSQVPLVFGGGHFNGQALGESFTF